MDFYELYFYFILQINIPVRLLKIKRKGHKNKEEDRSRDKHYKIEDARNYEVLETFNLLVEYTFRYLYVR